MTGPARLPRLAPIAAALRCVVIPLLAAAAASPAIADDTPPITYNTPSFSDWGGTGLWQTPIARMAPEGEFAFTASHVWPYTRYNFLLQPFSALEVTFRYSDINNRLYGPVSLSGHQTLKDKSIDAKVRLWRESRYIPDVAVGIRDLAGTGLFSGEYVVASKRWGPLDASLGLGWGYLGARGNLSNPLDILSSRFRTRPHAVTGSGGEFNGHAYFRGPTALFGGVSWYTPLPGLLVKLEYDGNDYRHEPQANHLAQRTPWNVGLTYRITPNIDLSTAYERGTTAMFSVSFHGNLASMTEAPKPLDPPPLPLPPKPQTTPLDQVDWARVNRELYDNAGITTTQVAVRGTELIVSGTPERYLQDPKSLGRMVRVLDQYVNAGINWYTLDNQQAGMSTFDASVDRDRFTALANGEIPATGFDRSVEVDQPTAQPEQVLYRAPFTRFHGAFAPGYQQSVGGPDAFVLYQISANYFASYAFTPWFWWSGVASYNVINNYDKFTYDAPSNLPRVRTFVRQYLTTSRLTLPTFQLTAARRIAPDWFTMAYAGMLESMYGGVGGEVLYRPFGERWAIGADVNWVRQRAFNQHFGFRPYHVTTGMLTTYYDTGVDGVLAKVSLGHYLAGDWGGTIDLSRHFRNGVRIGAWATFTDVSAKRFGEGSFDKGIYVSIPFDLLLPRSTRNRAGIVWQPLIRDGGAQLNRQYTLYDLTTGRDAADFYSSLDTITQ